MFLQVYNESPTSRAAATITITDTQAMPTARGSRVPATSSPTGRGCARQGRAPRTQHGRRHGPTQGLLLLYKIKVDLANRPLELKIVDPFDPSQTATAELDV